MNQLKCVTVLAAGFFVGAVSVFGADFTPRLDTDTACKITIAGGYNNFEALEAEADRFNAYYPDVEITYTKLDDYNNLISTALEGSNAPDICFSYAWMEGREQYNSVFAHAQDLADLEGGPDLSCIRDSVLNRNGENQVLMVPVFSTTYGMLVNMDLFENEGLAIPTTFQELLSVCEVFVQAGYERPVFGYSKDPSMGTTLAWPDYCARMQDQPEKREEANRLAKEAGETMRPTLEMLQTLLDSGYLDLPGGEELEDGYNALILRFFEGDIPMLLCSGDTVSGTQKREEQSEAFSANPFTYLFAPVPTMEDGAVFLDTPSVEFTVNKDAENLAMADEFMRFLISPEELSHMSEVKRLLSPAKDLSFEGIYAPFSQVQPENVVGSQALALNDEVSIQVRKAAFAVLRGELSVDEAIDRFGDYTN